MNPIDSALKLIEILATIAFALTGIIEARKKKMDLIGVYMVSMVTAFGGGTVRDMCIQHYPLFWIRNDEYPIGLLALCVCSMLVATQRTWNTVWMVRLLGVLDAFGLGLFCATGVQYALQAHCGMFVSVLMGVITATFGGVIRDVLCNEIPNVFKPTELYATCAFVGAASQVACLNVGMSDITALVVATGIAAFIRILAMFYDITLPKPLS